MDSFAYALIVSVLTTIVGVLAVWGDGKNVGWKHALLIVLMFLPLSLWLDKQTRPFALYVGMACLAVLSFALTQRRNVRQGR